MSEHDSGKSNAAAPVPQPDLAGQPSRTEVKHSLSFWQVVKLVEVRLRFIVILAVTGATIVYWDTLTNYWSKWTRPARPAAAAASDTEYYCPMHPSVVRSDLEPDGSTPKCPICGMPLSKRAKGEAGELREGVLSRVQFSPAQIRLAGIATAEVAYRPLVKQLRTVGIVNYDESRMSQVTIRVDGYVERLFVDKTFDVVAAGDKLAEIYSPTLYSTVRNLLTSLRGGSQELVESGRERLRLLGVAERDIDGILASGKASSTLLIRAPRGGHVIRKEIVDGSRVREGMMLFEVADLSVVWIEADVFEKDVALLREGQSVEAAVEPFPGRAFAGRVSLVHPHMQSDTRTNRVRFELENTDHTLRPGMYANVQLSVPMDEIEPFRGQAAETRAAADLKQTAADDASLIASQRVCPVTGAELGSMGTPVKVEADSYDVFLCCQVCDEKFEADPEHYTARLAGPPERAVLAVPGPAVIDTGSRTIVYIEREPGLFEGHEVELGPRSGEFYPVAKGLLPGDRVAAAGSFLVDAETRLNPAAAAAYLGAGGGALNRSGSTHSHRDTSHDSDAETPETRAAPGTPLAADKPSSADGENIAKLPDPADRKRALEQAVCPITGAALGSMGVPFKLKIGDDVVFLCCKGCEPKARKEGVEKVLRKVPPRD